MEFCMIDLKKGKEMNYSILYKYTSLTGDTLVKS